MTLRLLTAVIGLAAIGAGLLGLRQEQNNDRHTIASIHASMRDDREQIKDLQIRIATQTQPEALREAIKRTDLRLVPIGETPDTQSQSDSLAGGQR